MKREVNMTGYMAKFLFRILLDFLEVLYFFLVGYAMRLSRLLRDLMYWSSSLLTFKNLREADL